MQLPKHIQERLASEFLFAAKKMAETDDLAQKLYLFSAFYGEVGRMLNQHWDDDLGLMHTVLNAAHGTINNRMSVILAGERGAGIPKVLPDALTKLAMDLAELFQHEDIDQGALVKLLGRASTLLYASTGNGAYLYLKGVIKI